MGYPGRFYRGGSWDCTSFVWRSDGEAKPWISLVFRIAFHSRFILDLGRGEYDPSKEPTYFIEK